MIRAAHLLDDFSMGGVTRALTLFEEDELRAMVSSNVVSIDPNSLFAPSIKADLIVDHMALSWRRLAFLMTLKMRHPFTRMVHVEHSYTRAFERNHVSKPSRFRAMLRIASTVFHSIVCVSSAQRDWLRDEVGIKADKLRVIYPWTDRTSLFEVPALTHQGERPLRLLAYGRYAPVKNLNELIKAMRAFPTQQIELTVFGDGPDRRELESLAADLPHVCVNGSCSDPSAYLAQCDAVVIPSRYEAFGLVATEARMAGRPILVADVDGLPEQVGNAGLVAPMENAAQITAAIQKLTIADIQAMGEAGREEVRTQAPGILNGWKSLITELSPQRA